VRQTLIMAGFFFFTVLVAANGYSEITLSQSGGNLKAIGSDKTAQLNAETKSGTVADLNGGTGELTYDAATGAVDAKGAGATIALTYSIAKIYLDPAESVKVRPGEGYGEFSILNTSGSGDIIVIMPDMSKLSMPPGSQVSFIKTADGDYYMKVDSGIVQYTDPAGRTHALYTTTPPILTKGYETQPLGRSGGVAPGRSGGVAPATP